MNKHKVDPLRQPKRVGKMTLEHMMRVKQLDIGDKTYTLTNQPELPAGQYEVWVNGTDVEFVRVGEYGIDAEDRALLNNLLERGEHQ